MRLPGEIAAAFVAGALWCIAAPPLPQLTAPVLGLNLADLHDTYAEVHSGHPHEAIDIIAPRETPVRAVVPGTIRKLFLGKPGGNPIYEFDAAQVYCFYYAHLDRYSDGLKEGAHVKSGGKEWWKGEYVNPY